MKTTKNKKIPKGHVKFTGMWKFKIIYASKKRVEGDFLSREVIAPKRIIRLEKFSNNQGMIGGYAAIVDNDRVESFYTISSAEYNRLAKILLEDPQETKQEKDKCPITNIMEYIEI